MSTCRSCGAAIVWALTTAGKRIPLDADAAGTVVMAEAGGLVPHETTPDGTAIVRAEPGAFGMRTHFSTCPNAAAHRRRA